MVVCLPAVHETLVSIHRQTDRCMQRVGGGEGGRELSKTEEIGPVCLSCRCPQQFQRGELISAFDISFVSPLPI